MNGSCVIAKIAGIESTANRMSVDAMTMKTASSGVATRLPLTLVNQLVAVVVLGHRDRLRSCLSSGLFSGSISVSSWRASFHAV